jgi:hypothetical protein
MKCKRQSASHEDSEEVWNAGLPSILWHSAQVCKHSSHLHALTIIHPPGNSLALISVRRWVNPGLLNAYGSITSLENFQGSTRNWTWNRPSCGRVPQPTAPPLTPIVIKAGMKMSVILVDKDLQVTWRRSVWI